MNYDQYGQCWTTVDELAVMLYQNPDLDLGKFHVKSSDEPGSNLAQYNRSVKELYTGFPEIKILRELDIPLDKFDALQQGHWHMPEEYCSLDIAAWVLDQCTCDAELQRCGEELLLFQERDAFDLLRYMKYLVDTLRSAGVVWGVGRGSSVASFVLYKIGIHRINSLEYELDPREFLK
jgi:hypothetical protein